MVHRHASWHPQTVAARDAMKAEPGIVLNDEEKDSKRTTSIKRLKEGMTLRKVNNEGTTSKRPVNTSSIPESLDGLDANAVLGIPLPKEEEQKKPKQNDDGVIGKIINLSDLLGGGESGNDDAENGIGDALADLFSGSADSDSTSISGKGTPDDPFIKRRIIKVGPEGIENLSASKKKDPKADDKGEKNITIDLRNKSEEERRQVLSSLVDGVLNDAQFDDGDEDATDEDSNTIDVPVSTSYADDKETLRQRCITTLRKLSENGMISGKQKRVLLTDIITSSARGETSLIETAFELLCADEEVVGDDTEGMEDFSEQCRVFAEVEREY